jgi:hypothetical protein
MRKEFGNRTRAKDGLFSECKVCRSKHAKQYYVENKKYINEVNAQWKTENADKHRGINARWRINHLEEHREAGKKWYRENIYRRKLVSHKWYQRNTESVIKRGIKWKMDHPEQAKLIRQKTGVKIRSTPQGRLNCSMTSAIGCALKGLKAGRRWETLVGYTVFELKTHLEKQFHLGISWDNYGSVWEIDHKIPKVVFNFQTAEDVDFRRCWSLENLQPLGKLENRHKYDKLYHPFQPSLLIREAVNG